MLSPPPLYFGLENSKNTRNELARPVMGTIFLVVIELLRHVFDPSSTSMSVINLSYELKSLNSRSVGSRFIYSIKYTLITLIQDTT